MNLTRTRVGSICAAVTIAVLTGCSSEESPTAAPTATRTSTAAAPTTARAAGENWDTVPGLTSPTAKDIEFLNGIDADDPRWSGETGMELSYHARGNCSRTIEWLVDNHAGAKAIIPRVSDRRTYFEVARQVYC